VVGNPNPEVERLNDFEAGYRVQISPKLSVDAAAFMSFYRNLRTVQELQPYFVEGPGQPHVVLPALVEYYGRARTYGGELFVNWKSEP